MVTPLTTFPHCIFEAILLALKIQHANNSLGFKNGLTRGMGGVGIGGNALDFRFQDEYANWVEECR
jgi:hypothetical protein